MIEKKLGLYFHIPYCVAKCDYCDFVSTSGAFDPRYLTALKKEINDFKGEYTVATAYFGGGTPSVMPNGAIEEILAAARKRFNFFSECAGEGSLNRVGVPEITIEINPATADRDKIAGFRRAGVNRASVGLQSANDALISRVGRVHGYADFLHTIDLLVGSGITNISADIMLGLPDQTVLDVVNTLTKLVELPLTHISMYMLNVERGTPLFGYEPREDILAEMYSVATSFLREAGFFRYEVSNFCKNGFESRHNLAYWNMSEYAGFGVSAHSYIDNTRYFNQKDIFDYIVHGAVKNIDVRDTEDFRTEYLMLALRTARGLDLSQYNNRFGRNFLIEKEREINKAEQNGLIIIADGWVMLTDKGFPIMNSIIIELL